MTTKPTGPVLQDGAASHPSDVSAALDVEISGALLALPPEDATQPPALRQALRGTAEALQAMRVALVLTDADGVVRELSAALDCLPWPTSDQAPELFAALTLTRGHLRRCKDLLTSRLLESAPPVGSHFGHDRARPAPQPLPVPEVPPFPRLAAQTTADLFSLSLDAPPTTPSPVDVRRKALAVGLSDLAAALHCFEAAAKITGVCQDWHSAVGGRVLDEVQGLAARARLLFARARKVRLLEIADRTEPQARAQVEAAGWTWLGALGGRHERGYGVALYVDGRLVASGCAPMPGDAAHLPAFLSQRWWDELAMQQGAMPRPVKARQGVA
ncbi:hypothetical protein ACLEPN_30550 [Myxococcus sp. 1LA]